MMSQNPPSIPLFDGFSDDEVDRFLAGCSTPDEAARFAEYVRGIPEEVQWRAAVKRYRLTTAADFRADLTSGAARDLVAKRLGAFPGARPESTSATPHRSVTPSRQLPSFATAVGSPQWRSLGVRFAMACAALVVLTVAVSVWPVRHSAAVATTTYRTADAQLLRLTLRDGSRVTLAPNSRLEVARDFRAQRTLALIGRAYFDVAHTTGAPFLVRTGSVTTRVLGTAFDVTHYTDAQDTRVIVANGKVAVGGRQTVTVTAGQIGRATDSTAVLVAGSASGTDWTSGTLSFRNATITDMLETVGQWYGVQFRLADSVLASQAVTATFRGESRAEALALIQTVLNVTMTFDETPRGMTIVTLRAKSRLSHGVAPLRHPIRDTSLGHTTEVGR